MADIVKEIYNGTILFGNYTDSLQTLATTDANTTLVVKDVEVGTSSYTTAPNLQVGNFNVGTLRSNLSGNEILGTNSSLKIKNNESASFYSGTIRYISNPTTNPTLNYETNPTAVLVGSGTISGTVAQSTSTSFNRSLENASSGQVPWAFYLYGRLYYLSTDGNSTTYFYVVDQNGSQTIINNDSYSPVAFDGDHTFYWFENYYIYKHDASTQTTTQLVYFGLTPSTYAACWFSNGILFFRASYSGGTIYAYNVITNVVYTVSGYTFTTTFPSNQMFAFYDSSTLTHRLYISNPSSGYAGSFYYIDIVQNSAGTSFTASSQINYDIATSVRIAQFNPSSTYIFGFKSGDTSKIYKYDKTLTSLGSITVTDANFSSYPMAQFTLSAATTQQLNDYGPQIQLRITGVQSTI